MYSKSLEATIVQYGARTSANVLPGVEMVLFGGLFTPD